MKQQKDNWVKILFSFAAPCKGKMALSVFCAILSVAGGFIPFWAVYEILLAFINQNVTLNGILIWCLVGAAGYLLRVACHGISTILAHISAYTILEGIRLKIADRLMKAPLGEVMGRRIGYLKNIIMDKVEDLEPPLAHMIPELTSNLLLPVAIFTWMMVIDWRMGLAVLIAPVLAMIPMFFLMRNYNSQYAAYMEANNHVNSIIIEYVEGIEVVKAFNQSTSSYEKFVNLPELMATFKQVADIQTADMLKLPVPKANFHTEVIQPSELQQEMVRGLAERAEAIRAGGVDPRVDNMLRITNDGRKLALDMRLINPLAADDPNGKVATCARNVIRIWEQTKEQRSAQLVFCDLSTPSKTTPIEMQKNGDGVYEMIPDQFTDVYNDLKKKLMEAGIPEEEIAFIHDANTEARKKELFSKVRSGQVRILMGSTQKMGAGTNVQDRLIALHDLDCPWRPSNLAQRLGRIVRQGNMNPQVEIFRYVTEGTFDAYLYQLVENKQKFIAQIMTSKAPVRVADDVDETALSYSEIKALATGNPLIIEKCNLDMEVGKLNMLKASYLSQKYALEDMVLKKYPEAVTRLEERIAGYEQDVQLAAAHPKPQEGFVGITILDQPYADKEAAGKEILDVCTKMTGSDAVFLGQYRGFSLVLSYDGLSNEYRMTMKGTLSHTAVLGADVFGNLTRMDNVIDGLPGKLEAVRAELADTQVQLENARTELTAPFAREAELAEKTARLKELNILLNMDQKDNSLIDDVPDEDTPEKSKVRDHER